MRSILVTGGAGFIGANFVDYWQRRHPQDRLLVLDALTYAGNVANLRQAATRPGFRFVQGDIGDEALVERLLREAQVDTLVHFAAESHVDRSISGPDAFLQADILGTHSLLKCALKVWRELGDMAGKRFHHVSTDEVYGSLAPDDPAFRETTPYAPNSPYAASKAASDHLVRAYHHTYGLPVSTSNCSNNYGPPQFPEKLLPLCLLNMLEGRPLPIYGGGRQVRDWLFVDDHSRGIELILARGRVGECYNIGGNNEQANLDTVRLLCGIVDRLCREQPELAARFPRCPASSQGACADLITFVTDRPGHDTRYAIDATKISVDLGYVPGTSFAQGLESTVRWYLDNEAWWRAVQDGSYRSASLASSQQQARLAPTEASD